MLRYVGSSANLLLALTRGRRGNEINYTPSWLPFEARKEIEIIRIKRVPSNISLGPLRKFPPTGLAYGISFKKWGEIRSMQTYYRKIQIRVFLKI